MYIHRSYGRSTSSLASIAPAQSSWTQKLNCLAPSGACTSLPEASLSLKKDNRYLSILIYDIGIYTHIAVHHSTLGYITSGFYTNMNFPRIGALVTDQGHISVHHSQPDFLCATRLPEKQHRSKRSLQAQGLHLGILRPPLGRQFLLQLGSLRHEAFEAGKARPSGSQLYEPPLRRPCF